MKCYVGKFMKFHVGMKVQKHKMVISHLKQSKNEKNKGTLLSSTFKVQESKVPLFFGFWTVLNEIWPSSVFGVHPQCWWRGGYKSNLEAIVKYTLCFFWLLTNIGEWPKKLKKKSQNHRTLLCRIVVAFSV